MRRKGWGAATIESETKSASKLLKNFNFVNCVIFDVGANKGLWSLDINRRVPKADIYSFEPSSKAFEALSLNTKYCPNISIAKIGFSNIEGKSILYSESSGSGFASLSQRRVEHFGMSMNQSEEIQLTTLDTFSQKLGMFPHLIKLDVEGYELDVLRGASIVLRHVFVIQFEFGGCNLDTRTTFQDFWYFFKAIDFEIYRLTPAGLRRISSYKERDESYQTTNYFAVSKNKKVNPLQPVS